MKKIILFFVLMSGFVFGQNTYDVQYQQYWDKSLSKIKMETLLSDLVNHQDKELSVKVIEATEDGYVLQFSGTAKMKLAISFYENKMSFTFYEHYYLDKNKYISIDNERAKVIDENVLNTLKSHYYNNL